MTKEEAKTCQRLNPEVQATFFRRRHQPKRPTLAKIAATALTPLRERLSR
jgi:hypothetical protein